MKKSKEELKEELLKSLTEKFAGKELNEEVAKEIEAELAKALQAGYDIAEPEEKVKEVDPSAGPQRTAEEQQKLAEATGEVLEDPTAAKEEEVKAEEPAQEAAAEEVEAEPAPAEPKFANGLFKPFSLGSTLEQSPSGNVMSNMKQAKMDYVERAKNHKNTTLTDKDFSKESK